MNHTDISSSYFVCLVVTVISIANENELIHLGVTAFLTEFF